MGGDRKGLRVSVRGFVPAIILWHIIVSLNSLIPIINWTRACASAIIDSGLWATMRVPACVSGAILSIVLSTWSNAQDVPFHFSGRVAKGELFQKDIPGGLKFRLVPTATDPGAVEGWTIQVSPKADHLRECDDFVWVVMQPYRNYNARYIDTSYGTTAEEAVKYSPREFNFVLNCSDYRQEAERVNRVLWPYNYSDAEVKDARGRLGTSPQGKGRLWIRDSRVSPAPRPAGDVNLGQIDSITFEVQIEIPRQP